MLLFSGLSSGAALRTPAEKSFDPAALLSVSRVPAKASLAPEPVIEARAALAADVESGRILYQKNSHERLPMASLTKIMTAMIILEHHSPDEIVTVRDDFNKAGDVGVRVWLAQYEKITAGDLLTALLLPSAGDAALALAVFHSDSADAFVGTMNRRAVELGLKNTRFTNPIGIDEEGHFSTAFDLELLTRHALRSKEFRRIIRMPAAVAASVDGRIRHELYSTNELLNSYLNVIGVKTGTTKAAGQSVINLARNPGGHEVLTVILDSPDRFQESKNLLDWAFRNFFW